MELYRRLGTALSRAEEVRTSLGELRADLEELRGALTALRAVGGLSEAVGRLREVAERLTEANETLSRLSLLVAEAYEETHSRDFNETLETLERLAVSGLPGVSSRELMDAAIYLRTVQETTAELRASLPTRLPTAEELAGVAALAETTLEVLRTERLEKYVEGALELIEAAESPDLWEAVRAARSMYEKVPPETLEGALEAARGAYPRLAEAVRLAVSYPPGKVRLAAVALLCAGLVLALSGSLLVRKGLAARR